MRSPPKIQEFEIQEFKNIRGERGDVTGATPNSSNVLLSSTSRHFFFGMPFNASAYRR
jgi:hypothetical protein